MKKYLQWLQPGLGVKRWVLLIMAGIFLLAMGLTLSILSDRLVMITGVYVKAKLLEWAEMPSVRILGVGMMVAATVLLLFAFYRLIQTIISPVQALTDRPLMDSLVEEKTLKRGPRVVVLGGGTGLSVLLSGLKLYTSNITAIVAVSDDGGSSGRLREEYAIAAPGDIRNCLIALAPDGDYLAELLDYRFEEGGLGGHSFGNLFLLAMTQVTGSFENAVKESHRVLKVMGRVLPSASVPVELKGHMDDGRTITGETALVRDERPIEMVSLEPSDPPAPPESVEAILDADLIILGPGSLYTSIIPNLLVPGIRNALKETKAPIAYAGNIMTQPGETDHMRLSDHVVALTDHCPGLKLSAVFANLTRPAKNIIARYAKEGSHPLENDLDVLKKMQVPTETRCFRLEEGKARHEGDSLASEILDWYARYAGQQRQGGI